MMLITSVIVKKYMLVYMRELPEEIQRKIWQHYYSKYVIKKIHNSYVKTFIRGLKEVYGPFVPFPYVKSFR